MYLHNNAHVHVCLQSRLYILANSAIIALSLLSPTPSGGHSLRSPQHSYRHQQLSARSSWWVFLAEPCLTLCLCHMHILCKNEALTIFEWHCALRVGTNCTHVTTSSSTQAVVHLQSWNLVYNALEVWKKDSCWLFWIDIVYTSLGNERCLDLNNPQD